MSEWTLVENSQKMPRLKRRTTWGDRAKGIKKVVQDPTTHPLDSAWVLWYHNSKSSNWTLSGYEELYTFDTIEDFWLLFNNLYGISTGMYYLMKQGYPPIWDSSKNIGGGGWSFRVENKNLENFWLNIALFCIGGTICDNPELITGISLSPKRGCATVRLWTSLSDGDTSIFSEMQKECAENNIPINFDDARFSLNKTMKV